MRLQLFPILAAILPLIATADPNAGIPEDCPELRVVPVSVPDEQNAHVILMKLPPPPKSSVEHPESFYDLDLYWRYQSKTEKPTGIIIAKAKILLTRHTETMRVWDAALAAPYFVEPPVNGFSDIDISSNFAALRGALFGNLWRIRIATYEGRNADAFNDWLRVRTALLSQSEQSSTLLSGMMRSSFLAVVNKEAWMLNPTAAEATRCRPKSVRFPVNAYQKTIRGEARFGVVAVPKTDAEIETMLRWSRTKPEASGVKTVSDYRTQVLPKLGDIGTRARETRDEIRRMEAAGFLDPTIFKRRLSTNSPWIRRANATAILETDGINIFDWVYFIQWADAIACTQADLVLAIRAYAAEHKGILPPTLDALIPQYADAIPFDPFDGKPMRYDAKTPKLWSIGPDFIDNHGVCSNPPRRSDMTGDITSYLPNLLPASQPGSIKAAP